MPQRKHPVNSDNSGYPVASWVAALNNDFAHASMTSADIVRQEHAGAQRAASEAKLPKQGLPVDLLRAAGWHIGDEVDDIYYQVTLPDGWRKAVDEQGDGRGLVLFDEQNRIRARMFIKEAWYDRYANIHFERRYSVGEFRGGDVTQPELSWEEQRVLPIEDWRDCAVVRDTMTGAILYASAPYGARDLDTVRAEYEAAKQWLAAHYPDWDNPLMYWE